MKLWRTIGNKNYVFELGRIQELFRALAIVWSGVLNLAACAVGQASLIAIPSFQQCVTCLSGM